MHCYCSSSVSIRYVCFSELIAIFAYVVSAIAKVLLWLCTGRGIIFITSYVKYVISSSFNMETFFSKYVLIDVNFSNCSQFSRVGVHGRWIFWGRCTAVSSLCYDFLDRYDLWR